MPWGLHTSFLRNQGHRKLGSLGGRMDRETDKLRVLLGDGGSESFPTHDHLLGNLFVILLLLSLGHGV